MDSTCYRKESRGACGEDYGKRDDKNFMKHTLAWQSRKRLNIEMFIQELSQMTFNIFPKERV